MTHCQRCDRMVRCPYKRVKAELYPYRITKDWFDRKKVTGKCAACGRQHSRYI